MEHKDKKTASKGKSSSNGGGHTSHKRKAETKAISDASKEAPGLVNTTTGGTFNTTAGTTEDMATLSAAQEALVFDMSNSGDPIGDRRAAEDARTQAAIEPVGTQAATEPIITEDGVITRNA